MDIKRHQYVGPKDAEQMINHCLSQIEDHGFADGLEVYTDGGHTGGGRK